MSDDQNRREIRSYVLRASRLSNLQQRAMDSLAGTFCIPYKPEPVSDLSRKFFDNDNPVILEIGFGMGISTARIAAERPDTNFIGIEVHRPGIGKLLSEIDRLGLQNVRIIEYDAVKVLQHMVKRQSIDGLHIFFPDPWPKKKHHKRRLIQEPFLSLAASTIRPGGYVYMVTDWYEYALQMLEVTKKVPILENPYQGFAPSMPWRPQTKFERKGLDKSHPISELYLRRV